MPNIAEQRRAIFAAFSECLAQGDAMTPNEIADKLLAAMPECQPAGAQANPAELAANCEVNIVSSRMCERGTKSCIVEHAATQPAAQPVSDEQIKAEFTSLYNRKPHHLPHYNDEPDYEWRGFRRGYRVGEARAAQAPTQQDDPVAITEQHGTMDGNNPQEEQTKAAPVALYPMPNEEGEIKAWYFSSDTFYLDVEKDNNGKLSIFVKDRTDNKEGWLDQAEDSATALPAQGTLDARTASDQHILEALETGLECAEEVAETTHKAYAGYKPHKHAAVDAYVQKIKDAIAALKAHANKPNEPRVLRNEKGEMWAIARRSCEPAALRDASAYQQEEKDIGRNLEGVPQPYAGIIVLLETIALSGCTAFYTDGTATPNRKLCLRFAKELRDYWQPRTTNRN